MDENNNLVGMITEGDFLRHVELGTALSSSWWRKFASPNATAESYVSGYGRKVGEVMTQNVISVSPDCGLDDVVTLMEEHQIKRVSVMSKGQLIGIVSRSDLLRVLVQKATPPVAQKRLSDAEIRRRLMAEIEKHLRSLTWVWI